MGLEEYVFKLNKLLARIKVPIVIRDLNECVPTLWVALYEGLFECRIPGIDRSFEMVTRESSRLKNVQLVLEELALNVLKMDLSHIHAQDLVDRKEKAIKNIIEIFDQIGLALDKNLGQDMTEESLSTDIKGKKRVSRPFTEDASFDQQAGPSVIQEHKEEALNESELSRIEEPPRQRQVSAGIPQRSAISPESRKRKRRIYRNKEPIAVIKDDVAPASQKSAMEVASDEKIRPFPGRKTGKGKSVRACTFLNIHVHRRRENHQLRWKSRHQTHHICVHSKYAGLTS